MTQTKVHLRLQQTHESKKHNLHLHVRVAFHVFNFISHKTIFALILKIKSHKNDYPIVVDQNFDFGNEKRKHFISI